MNIIIPIWIAERCNSLLQLVLAIQTKASSESYHSEETIPKVYANANSIIK